MLESDKRLKLFGYSLTRREKDWLDTLPSSTILDWYFPTAKYFARKKEISSLKQQEVEILDDAWERFKIMLKIFPGHKFSDMDIMQVFTTGLKPDTRMLRDASARGSMGAD